MPGMTLKDLLPGLIGAGVGAISPQAGRAGANTLEMADAFNQRRRKQGLEDERMDMSRASAGRAEQTHEWASENFAYNERKRLDEANEKAHAQQVGADMLAGFEEAGLDLPEHFTAPLAGAESLEQVNQLGQQIQTFISKTPISMEEADRIGASLKAPMYVNVRLPDGQVARRVIGPYGSSRSQTGVTGTLEAVNDFQDALGNYGIAQETLAGQEQEARAKEMGSPTLSGSEMASMPSSVVARAGEGGVPVPRYTTAAQRGKVASAEQDVGSAMNDIQKMLIANPGMVGQVQQFMAGTLTQGVPAPAAPTTTQPGAVDPVQAKIQQYGG